MADANQTKKAMADALRARMYIEPFSKISVGEICEGCGMSRKSFYYHFKDKYDLVNWIYHTQVLSVLRQNTASTGWEQLEDLCEHFYAQRNFYCKTLHSEGQDAFSAYFKDAVSEIIKRDLQEAFREEASPDFFVDFYADAFVCAIKRWLLRDDLTAKEFVDRLIKCLLRDAAPSPKTPLAP